MQKNPRKKVFLILVGISLIILLGIIFFFPPSYSVSGISMVFIMLLTLFIFIYSVIAFIFRSFIHGILIGLFPIAYVLFRLNDLKSPLFFILLTGIFIALELLLTQLLKKSPH